MQKFKFLAMTQCSIAAPSPTRSPSASPVIHLRRRRKTLRMLLGRSTSKRRNDDMSTDRRFNNSSPEKGKELSVRSKLRDLFVSSPPAFGAEDIREGLLLPQSSGGSGSGVVRRSVGGRMMRPLSSTFRQRMLLRRAWRPVLVAIPE